MTPVHVNLQPNLVVEGSFSGTNFYPCSIDRLIYSIWYTKFNKIRITERFHHWLNIQPRTSQNRQTKTEHQNVSEYLKKRAEAVSTRKTEEERKKGAEKRRGGRRRKSL